MSMSIGPLQAPPGPPALPARAHPALVQAMHQRVVAVDALRGAVLMLLLPDLAGGFSFYKMAEAHPGDRLWVPLAAQFQHVAWSGVALWDLVMPVFVFLAGVSMGLSYDKRLRAGHTPSSMLGHAVRRSATLLLLGVLLQYKPHTRLEELLPFVVFSTGLPLAGSRRRAQHVDDRSGPSPATVYATAVLLLAAAWITLNYRRLGNYQVGSQILATMGLSYLPAFLLLRLRPAMQAAAALFLVSLYGLAFVLYVPPAGAVPTGEAFEGLFGHWNNGTNLGCVFDQWLFATLPRSEPYTCNAHGYHTLQVVPLIAVMLVGAMAGRTLSDACGVRTSARRHAWLGVAGLAVSGVLAHTLFPLVKSLWTPTWTLFSTSVCLLLLAAATRLLDTPRAARAARPLVILGSNSILLYVLAFTESWRIEALWQRMGGHALIGSISWWPVLQSCLLLATLWAFAWLLFRLRILVRV